MNSYIFIDGPVLWVVMALIVVLIIGFIYFGFHCVEVEKANDRLRASNTKLRRELSATQDKLYRATYRTPEVDDG